MTHFTNDCEKIKEKFCTKVSQCNNNTSKVNSISKVQASRIHQNL